MAHNHDHHDDLSNYFIEQIFTIAISGAIGAVAVSMYYQNKLRFILASRFHIWALLGGVVLLLLVFIRAIAVWQLAGKLRPAHVHDHDHHEHVHDHDHACCGHDHDHEHLHSEAITTTPAPQGTSLAVVATPPALPAAVGHNHGHDHDHADCGHSHGHDNNHAHSHGAEDGHEHGWAPWRYVLLLLPVALFFMNLPSEAFSSTYNAAIRIGDLDLPGQNADGADAPKKEVDETVGFLDLERASTTPDSRTVYAGKTVRLTGQFVGIDDKSFSLTRYKLNCCAADAIALNSVILVDYSHLKGAKYPKLEPLKYRNKWVQVTGTVQFLKRRNSNDYVTALIVTPTEEKRLSELIMPVQQPPNPYVD